MRITLGAGSKKGSNLLGCGDQESIELAMKSTHAGCVRSQEKSRHAGCVRSPEGVRFHWPEYLMEAGELALYMFFACAFATLLQHPASPVRHLITSSLARRALYGLAMGSTVIGIITTPWGKQSGGHLNPAITFTFFRLGKLELSDGFFYATAQFCGAIAGVALATYALRGSLQNSAVRYAVTVPGVYGKPGAFIGELTISFLLMLTILFATNAEKLARYTPYFVGALFAIYIAFETPLSGMSM